MSYGKLQGSKDAEGQSIYRCRCMLCDWTSSVFATQYQAEQRMIIHMHQDHEVQLAYRIDSEGNKIMLESN